MSSTKQLFLANDCKAQATYEGYRADIDGLRALAIFLVIVFHTMPIAIPGGFVGVDVFFVISGYLISAHLFKELSAGTFSFVNFYSRRARRIFPALCLVMICSLAFAWIFLTPPDFKELGRHTAGGAGFIANLLYWADSSYFDRAAESKPLLHLWSLGIEEQFYLLWPLLLYLAHQMRFNLLVFCALLIGASFLMNLQLVQEQLIAAFYAPWSRFWEILIGGFAAYLQRTPASDRSNGGAQGDAGLAGEAMRPVFSKRFSDTLSVSGLLCIVLAAAVVTKRHAFPGWWAVLPTFGTVFILLAGPAAWLNRRFFANRFLVALGLISFPLYLWHWPLLTYARILTHETVRLRYLALAVLLSVLLSYLTYRFLEKPIRAWRASLRTLIVLSFPAALILALGLVIYSEQGFPRRTLVASEVVNQGELDWAPIMALLKRDYFPCRPDHLFRRAILHNKDPRCFQSLNREAQELAIVGDSHAEHLFIGLAQALPSKNLVYFNQTRLPLTSEPLFEDTFKHVLHSPSIKIVILSAYWSSKLKRIGADEFEAKLGETIQSIRQAGKEVYLFEDIPTFDFYPPQCKFASSLFFQNRCQEPDQSFNEQSQAYRKIFLKLKERFPDLKVPDLGQYFCTEGICQMARNGKLYYWERDHLNPAGSSYVAQRVVKDWPALRD